jgi:hypothetical protein
MKSYYRFLGILFFAVISYASHAQWTALGNDDFNQPSPSYAERNKIVVNRNNGEKYIAYVEKKANNILNVRASKWANNKWNDLGIVEANILVVSTNTTSYATNIDLVLDANGIPYVGYLKRIGGRDRVTIKHWDGSAWIQTSYAQIDPTVNSSDLTLSFSNGSLFASYIESTVNDRSAYVRRYNVNGDSWSTLGAGPFIIAGNGAQLRSRMISAPNGNVYVAFNFGGIVSLRKYDYGTTSWSVLASGIFANGVFTRNDYMNIALDNSEVIYIAALDQGNNDKLTVKKFNGGLLTQVGVEVSSGNPVDADLEVSGSNIYVLYQESDSKVVIASYNGTVWNTSGTPINSIIFQAADLSLSIDENSRPIFVSKSGIAKRAAVQWFDGTNWALLPYASYQYGNSAFASVTTDNNNVPYLVYSNSFSVQVQKLVANNWINVGGSQPQIAQELDIDFDASNRPFISYVNIIDNNIHVKYFDGTNWVNVPSPGNSNFLNNVPMKIDKLNNLWIAYPGIGDVLVVKKYNINTGVWSIISAGLSTGQATYSDIAFDANNNLYVVYRDAAVLNFAIVQKYTIGTLSWSTLGAASSGSATNVNIDISTTGQPYVAYVDGTTSATVRSYNSGSNSWNNVGPSNITPTQLQDLQFKLLSGATPVIVYTDTDDNHIIKAKKYDAASNSWIYTGNSLGQVSFGSSRYVDLETRGTTAYVAYISEDYSGASGGFWIRSATIGTLLPIDFGKLSCTQTNAGNKLNWAAYKEDGISKFEVEHSIDGKTFTVVGSVTPTGTGSLQQNYYFDHISNSAKSFYRIKAIEKGGNPTYSNVVLVYNNSAGTTSLSPNPTKNILNVRIQNDQAENATVTITNMYGQKIQTEMLSLIKGVYNTTINVAQLPAGMYFLDIVKKKGTAHIKFVKN